MLLKMGLVSHCEYYDSHGILLKFCSILRNSWLPNLGKTRMEMEKDYGDRNGIIEYLDKRPEEIDTSKVYLIFDKNILAEILIF